MPSPDREALQTAVTLAEKRCGEAIAQRLRDIAQHLTCSHCEVHLLPYGSGIADPIRYLLVEYHFPLPSEHADLGGRGLWAGYDGKDDSVPFRTIMRILPLTCWIAPRLRIEEVTGGRWIDQSGVQVSFEFGLRDGRYPFGLANSYHWEIIREILAQMGQSYLDTGRSAVRTFWEKRRRAEREGRANDLAFLEGLQWEEEPTCRS